MKNFDPYPMVLKAAGYGLAGDGESERPDVLLLATGSEVHLALNARDRLGSEGVRAGVVSLPCWSLFKEQPEAYQREVLPDGVPLLAIEAGVTLGWHSYVGLPVAVLGVDRYGASAPGDVVMREYGFTVENVCRKVRDLLPPAKNRNGIQ